MEFTCHGVGAGGAVGSETLSFDDYGFLPLVNMFGTAHSHYQARDCSFFECTPAATLCC